MMLTLLVSSKEMAGVARASLVVVLAVAASFHLPSEPIFLLFGIDQLMDMARTSVNVLGNCLATVVMARWEGTGRGIHDETANSEGKMTVHLQGVDQITTRWSRSGLFSGSNATNARSMVASLPFLWIARPNKYASVTCW